MNIPNFRNDGWLPTGHYSASWDEIEYKFSGQSGSQRQIVMQKLLDWRNKMKENNISGLLILNGSFISDKLAPNDFDAMFLYDDKSEIIFNNNPELKSHIDYNECKKKGFDLFAFPLSALSNDSELNPAKTDLYDFDRNNVPKGVLEVRI